MAVTVTRYGGISAMRPKTRTIHANELDETVRNALDRLTQAPAASAPARRMPDAFTYVFTIEEDGEPPKQLSVTGPMVPNELRKLLP